jgi:hypothetical protein
LTAWWKTPVCAAAAAWLPVWAFIQNAFYSAKMYTRYTIPKMTILTKCAYVAGAAQTGFFHHAVKHQTLVAAQSAYHLRISEVWCLTAEWKCRRRALRRPI